MRIASTIGADHQVYGITRKEDEVWIAEATGTLGMRDRRGGLAASIYIIAQNAAFKAIPLFEGKADSLKSLGKLPLLTRGRDPVVN
jgi:hypothetical protein